MPDFNLLCSNSCNLTEFYVKLLTVDLIVISVKFTDMRWTISHTAANLKESSRKLQPQQRCQSLVLVSCKAPLKGVSLQPSRRQRIKTSGITNKS